MHNMEILNFLHLHLTLLPLSTKNNFSSKSTSKIIYDSRTKIAILFQEHIMVFK